MNGGLLLVFSLKSSEAKIFFRIYDTLLKIILSYIVYIYNVKIS
jgi:hypothetical protein